MPAQRKTCTSEWEQFEADVEYVVNPKERTCESIVTGSGLWCTSASENNSQVMWNARINPWVHMCRSAPIGSDCGAEVLQNILDMEVILID